MKFFIKRLSSKCDQMHSFLRIWSHLMEKYLMEDFIFCAVTVEILYERLETQCKSIWFEKICFYFLG